MEKIDFVLTWVDGSDPDWLAQRRNISLAGELTPGRADTATGDNLQYWFRGVEKFAPWVNKNIFCYMGTCSKVAEYSS